MLTVLLATRNRAQILRDVLESFCQLQDPVGGWRLVVVDNGSTDETPRVIESFADRLPLHYVSEPSPGKNAALNAGLALVEGDLTILTDDDVFPHRDWLVRLRTAADTHQDHALFGGAVIPRWEVPPPEWIKWLDLGPIFTITPPSMVEGEIPPHLITLVQGPNMAIRTSVFESGIRFDPVIGPRGSDYPMGSETELILRLGGQGHKAWHVRGAVVEHFVRAEQLNKDWILRRAIRYGRGHYRLSPNAKLWGPIPRHLFRDLPKEGLNLALAWLTFDRGAALRARWRFNYLLGKGIEARNMAQERKACPTCGTEEALK